MRRELSALVGGLILVVSVGAFWAAGGSTISSPPSRTAISKRRRTAVTASPVAEPVPVPMADPFLLPSVQEYLRSQPGNITAALCNEESHEVYLYHPNDPQATASIVKVDILASLLYQAQESRTQLSEHDRELAVAMIEDSNDDAADDLWIALGRAAAVQVVNSRLGMTQTALNDGYHWGLSTTTPADQVKLLNALALPNSVLTASSQQYELKLMRNVVAYQAWGVSAGLPPDSTIAIKNGWLPLGAADWQINSVGIASDASHTYAIAVMTTGDPSEGDGVATIDGVARRLWATLMPSPRMPTEVRP